MDDAAARSSTVLEPELGPARGRARGALGRHHEPQPARRGSAAATTSCGSAARTPRCSASTARPRSPRRAPRAPPASRPRSSRWLPEQRVPRHGVHARARRWRPRSCASPRRSRASPRALRRIHAGPPLATAFPTFTLAREYARRARGARRARCRRPTTRSRSSCPTRIGAALQRPPEHEPVPCHNDLLTRELPALDGDAADRRLGVRGDERPLLRPRQPGGQQRALRGRRARCCSRPTSASPPDDAARRRAAADAR